MWAIQMSDKNVYAAKGANQLPDLSYFIAVLLLFWLLWPLSRFPILSLFS